jgi:ectoine hydroxylase-related dioxygenase (phytanoyl-CoA dioxygenase family)
MLAAFERHADASFSAIMNVDRSEPAIREIMKDARCVDLLETLQGAEVVALMSQVLFKRVGTPYAAQAWNPHQDNCYPRAEHGAYITVNIFLADSDPDNGGLYVFPGSQKEGLLPAEPTPSYREIPGTNPGNTVRVPERYPRVDLSIPKGGMIVLHGDLIHGSYPNRTTDRSRPLFSISYITKGKDFIPGNSAKRTVIPLR